MKTIYEKTYANRELAAKAADKELSEGWKKDHTITKNGARWVVAKTAGVKKEKSKAIKVTKPIDPDKLTRKQFDGLADCPCCEGDIIKTENGVACRDCGWEFSFAAPKNMSSVLNSARKGYVKALSYAGNISADNNDQVAEALRGLTPAQVCLVADMVKDELPGFYESRYGNLNVGQRRMNAGNVIRAAHKNGEVNIENILTAIKKVA